MSMDEGSSNYAAVWYLMYKERINILLTPDPNHRTWNDARLALVSAGLWGHVLLASVTCRFGYCPWDEGTGLQQLRTSMEECMAVGNPHDPIFQHMLPHLLRDWGWESNAHEDGLLEEAWAALGESQCFKAKGPRPKSTRWFSIMDCLSWHDPHHHSKLIAFLKWGNHAGWSHTVPDAQLKPLIVEPPAKYQEPLKEQVRKRGGRCPDPLQANPKLHALVCTHIVRWFPPKEEPHDS